MAYIGYQPSQLATAPFAVNTFTGDGSTTTFTLSQSVPGGNEAMIEVVLENVIQSPIDAYTVGGATSTSLVFSEAPISGGVIYVIHKGEGTYNLQPASGSVTSSSLDPVLRNFTVDTYTGNGSATTYTLTDTPYSANSIIVTVDGIVQTATTNYTVSGTTLSFGTEAPASGAKITVVHMGFSTGNKSVADGTITTVKLNSAGIAPIITGGTITGATFAAGAVGTPSITTTGDTNTGIYFPAADTIAFTEGGTEAMRINSSGNVGIGTASPNDLLEVYGGNLRLRSTVNGSNGFLTFVNTSGTVVSSIYNYNGLLSLNEQLIINNSTGNVGIGVIPTTLGKLEIQVSATAPALWCQTGGTTNAYTIAEFRTGSNLPALTILGNGGATFGTSIGIGSATATTSGAGITFPATQSASSNANTLDDYEEGTWTPAISLNSGTATTYTTLSGAYTKIGRMVVATGNIIPSNGTFGSTNGYVRMTGLPFTVGGTNGVGSGLNASYLNNGVAGTVCYSTTVDVAFTSGSSNASSFEFIVTYFV